MNSATPKVFTIPPHVAFVDALAKGLLDQTRGDPMRLARATVLLPNRRAVRSLTEAFVRLSDEKGLLLPRMTPVGDVDEDEALGAFADDMAVEAELPPAVDDCKQRLILTGLVKRYLDTPGDKATAVEALRLADDLRRTLSQLLAEDVAPEKLRALDVGDLAAHWDKTLKFLSIVVDVWPGILAEAGEIDRVERDNRLLRAWTEQITHTPPDHMIVAAGMVAPRSVIGRMLGRIARLPNGMVVLPGLDTAMADGEWDAIHCRLATPDAPPRRESDAHPQFGFRCLLERMGVARGEVRTWDWTSGFDGPAARTAAVARAMAPAAFTGDWRAVDLGDDAIRDVRLIEAANPGEEAQVIALAMRRQLTEPGRTAALVTPDRGLARRVAAQLSRWGIALDDSAGTPLARTPPGTFLQALVEAATQAFAPVPLLALLKHPLVRGEARLAWLDRVRQLDLALRGVRPPPGLDAIGAHVHERRLDATARRDAAGEAALAALEGWWPEVQAILELLERLFAAKTVSLPDLIDRVRAAAQQLAGDNLWRGPAGRSLGEIVAQLELHGAQLDPFDPPDAPGLIAAFLSEAAVRPPFGKHPRLAVYGLLEARLQRADLMILGGLNEGVWPALAKPDPWLAPAARSQLGMPGLDARIGLAAHDFVQAMGAKRVIVTRARRDSSAPTVASRFWLRLEALGGERLQRDGELLAIARGLDSPAEMRAATRPAPAPPAALRPRQISVTGAEKLKADPYSFYAEQMLGLRKLQALDEDPSAAERGTFLHAVLERWIKEKPDDPEHLKALADVMLDADFGHHPTMMALWAPRVRRAIDWVAQEMADWEAKGWRPVVAEGRGHVALGNGITLTGKADRIDRHADGSYAVIDYKTGNPPSHDQLTGGYALQLGLLGWLASDGNVRDLPPGVVSALRYWKLSGGSTPGRASDPLVFNRQPWADVGGFIDQSMAHFFALCETLLLGDAPFTAKLHPDYSTRYTDHDHLARVAEWLGRDAAPLPSGERATHAERERGEGGSDAPSVWSGSPPSPARGLTPRVASPLKGEGEG